MKAEEFLSLGFTGTRDGMTRQQGHTFTVIHGKLLAYISRGDGFKLMVMNLGTGEVASVSDTNDDESPSFAPNGRYIIYATKASGRDVLMVTTADGRFKSTLVESGLDIREPVWGPFGR